LYDLYLSEFNILWYVILEVLHNSFLRKSISFFIHPVDQNALIQDMPICIIHYWNTITIINTTYSMHMLSVVDIQEFFIEITFYWMIASLNKFTSFFLNWMLLQICFTLWNLCRILILMVYCCKVLSYVCIYDNRYYFL
jgi:hypothetical protein